MCTRMKMCNCDCARAMCRKKCVQQVSVCTCRHEVIPSVAPSALQASVCDEQLVGIGGEIAPGIVSHRHETYAVRKHAAPPVTYSDPSLVVQGFQPRPHQKVQ